MLEQITRELNIEALPNAIPEAIFHDVLMTVSESTCTTLRRTCMLPQRSVERPVTPLVRRSCRLGKSTFRDGFIRASTRFGLVLLVIAASYLIPPVARLPYPSGGLLVLAFATVANIGYWVHRAVRYARERSEVDESLRTAPALALFKSSEAGRFALAVTSVLVWATMFIAINAGFGILGF